MTQKTCPHSECDRVLRSDNRRGWCHRHATSAERYKADREYREALLAWWRDRCRTDPEYRERKNARNRDYYHQRQQDPNHRETLNARRRDDYRKSMQDPKKRDARNTRIRERSRERRANDPEYRKRLNAQTRDRVSRMGGRGYRRLSRRLDADQDNLCRYCGERMHDDVTVDHIYPVHLGGGDEIENLQAVHSACNSRKRARYDIFAMAGQPSP